MSLVRPIAIGGIIGAGIALSAYDKDKAHIPSSIAFGVGATAVGIGAVVLHKNANKTAAAALGNIAKAVDNGTDPVVDAAATGLFELGKIGVTRIAANSAFSGASLLGGIALVGGGLSVVNND